jgi:hypothetical protein
MKIEIDIRSTVLEIPDEEFFSKTASEARALVRKRVCDWLESNETAIDWRFSKEALASVAIAA